MMSNNNNANIKIVQMIQQVQQWNKKPSLNDRISDFLDTFHESINNGQINFAEAGLFLQETSILNGKQIDLLYKGFLECHKNLSDVYNDKKIQEEQQLKQDEITNKPVEQTIDETDKTNKKERKKPEIKKSEEQPQLIENVDIINTEDVDLTNPPQEQEKFSIPGIPDEVLEKLKLSDCLPGGPIDEFIDKLDKNHPLYSIISKLGKEISQNKDIFTYNNLSLSGMSWNALFKIEEVLSRITRRDDELNQNENEVIEQCQQTQTDDDSGIDTEHFNSGMTTSETTEILETDSGVPSSDGNLLESSSTLEESQIASDSIENPPESAEPVVQNQIASDSTENPSESAEPVVQPPEEPKKPVELTEELRKLITKECMEKVATINLLKLDYKLLMKKFNFRLPPEYFVERKSERLQQKRKAENLDTDIPSKRKKNENNSTQKQHNTTKSFDLNLFENFCYNYYESQGIMIPRPEPIQINRKSIDNRSEVSYGNPLTPADSGRFSLTFMTDSEFDHCDADDNCRGDSTLPFSRADSGIELMGRFSADSDDEDESPQSENVEENDTLKTLRALFPATFSDPERAEALKSLYKQPEDDENYMQWKKFIDEKTANEQEFNIHECGTDILNAFSLHSTDKLNFQTIVENKSVGDISRYFVSTLQLANTYNVEIVDKHPGEIRADNMQLKFLTNTRAHEEIDSNLNDISEDHFMDSLIMSKSKKYHSTPIHPTPVSVRSTHKLTKRKRLEYCD